MAEAMSLYWAYVKFTNLPDGKKRPVLVLEEHKKDYRILRITSKYDNKPKYIQKRYTEIKDWRKSNLPKPSWVDAYQAYNLPKNMGELEYICELTSKDLHELQKHFKL